MNYITERNYGDSFDTRADLVILCPHGSLGRSFIEEHRLYDLVDGVNLFDSFNKIEADIGSFELANAIASEVAQIRDGILVRVIEVNIPRSVIDCNRVESVAAVRRIVNWNDFGEKHRELMDVHAYVLAELKKLTKTGRHSNSLLLDLHTMSDFSPVCAVADSRLPALAEDELGLQSYVSNYLEALKCGMARQTNLITSLEGVCLADSHLMVACGEHLSAIGLQVSYDVPYSLSGRLMSTFYAKECRSLTIDFLKGSLHSSSDLIGAEVDNEKVERVASSMAKAFLSVIE